MEVFGWIMLSALAIFGIAILVIFAIPFVVTEIRTMSYKIKKAFEDRKLDIDKKSEERRNRDELKRQKEFELANKKLDAKLQKIDEQSKIYDKKMALVKEMKEATIAEKKELSKKAPKVKEEVKAEPVLAIDSIEVEKEEE